MPRPSVEGLVSTAHSHLNAQQRGLTSDLSASRNDDTRPQINALEKDDQTA